MEQLNINCSKNKSPTDVIKELQSQNVHLANVLNVYRTELNELLKTNEDLNKKYCQLLFKYEGVKNALVDINNIIKRNLVVYLGLADDVTYATEIMNRFDFINKANISSSIKQKSFGKDNHERGSQKLSRMNVESQQTTSNNSSDDVPAFMNPRVILEPLPIHNNNNINNKIKNLNKSVEEKSSNKQNISQENSLNKANNSVEEDTSNKENKSVENEESSGSVCKKLTIIQENESCEFECTPTLKDFQMKITRLSQTIDKSSCGSKDDHDISLDSNIILNLNHSQKNNINIRDRRSKYYQRTLQNFVNVSNGVQKSICEPNENLSESRSINFDKLTPQFVSTPLNNDEIILHQLAKSKRLLRNKSLSLEKSINYNSDNDGDSEDNNGNLQIFKKKYTFRNKVQKLSSSSLSDSGKEKITKRRQQIINTLSENNSKKNTLKSISIQSVSSIDSSERDNLKHLEGNLKQCPQLPATKRNRESNSPVVSYASKHKTRKLSSSNSSNSDEGTIPKRSLKTFSEEISKKNSSNSASFPIINKNLPSSTRKKRKQVVVTPSIRPQRAAKPKTLVEPSLTKKLRRE